MLAGKAISVRYVGHVELEMGTLRLMETTLMGTGMMTGMMLLVWSCNFGLVKRWIVLGTGPNRRMRKTSFE
jgi:hypothetical protein